jgi:hypothetical protein
MLSFLSSGPSPCGPSRLRDRCCLEVNELPAPIPPNEHAGPSSLLIHLPVLVLSHGSGTTGHADAGEVLIAVRLGRHGTTTRGTEKRAPVVLSERYGGGAPPCTKPSHPLSGTTTGAQPELGHAGSVHALLNCSVSRRSPCGNECRDMAERIRVQVRSGRRIRAQKQSGAVSLILLRVRAKVRFRVAVTTIPP